jgi:DNA-binding transcriptional MerR regulator
MAHSGPTALPDKLYFRIGEVAELVGVEPHVLRYWEREFRSIRPSKSAKGQRVYSRRDVETLMRVRQLLYSEGFTIAGARKRLHGEPEPELPAQPRSAAPAAPRTEPTVEKARAESPERNELLAIRAEIDAFLAELGPDAD